MAFIGFTWNMQYFRLNNSATVPAHQPRRGLWAKSEIGRRKGEAGRWWVSTVAPLTALVSGQPALLNHLLKDFSPTLCYVLFFVYACLSLLLAAKPAKERNLVLWNKWYLWASVLWSECLCLSRICMLETNSSWDGIRRWDLWEEMKAEPH